MRKINELDNVLKYNGTLSFRDAQLNEANKKKVAENKHRMPDGMAEKAFAAFEPHKPQ